MSARGVAAVALALAVTATPAAAPCTASAPPAASARPAAPLEASAALATRLAASGRGTARLERHERDPFTRAPVITRAGLALEPPDRARLDFDTGERVTLRADGGEWLQPQLGQLLRFSGDQSEAALRWWRLLLPGEAAHFREVAAGTRRWLVLAPQSAGFADSAWVELDRSGLPARLAFRDASGESVSVAFRDWRFARARGRAAFVLTAPPGVQTIELP